MAVMGYGYKGQSSSTSSASSSPSPSPSPAPSPMNPPMSPKPASVRMDGQSKPADRGPGSGSGSAPVLMVYSDSFQNNFKDASWSCEVRWLARQGGLSFARAMVVCRPSDLCMEAYCKSSLTEMTCVQVVNIDSPKQGKDWSNGICAYIKGNGALALRTGDMGKFQYKRNLILHVKQEGGGAPDVHINLSGRKVIPV